MVDEDIELIFIDEWSENTLDISNVKTLFQGDWMVKSVSSVKWSDPGHFFRAQGKFFLLFLCTLFYIFLTLKITNRAFKKFPGSLHFTLLSFLQYLNNYLGQLILSIF